MSITPKKLPSAAEILRKEALEAGKSTSGNPCDRQEESDKPLTADSLFMAEILAQQRAIELSKAQLGETERPGSVDPV